MGMACGFLGYNHMGASRFALTLEAEVQTRTIGETVDDPLFRQDCRIAQASWSG
jgi:hypothetical protein